MIMYGPRSLGASLEERKDLGSSKLAPKLRGPYTVIQQTKNDTKCQDYHSDTIRIFHSSRTSPYIGCTASTTDANLVDSKDYVVDERYRDVRERAWRETAL